MHASPVAARSCLQAGKRACASYLLRFRMALHLLSEPGFAAVPSSSGDPWLPVSLTTKYLIKGERGLNFQTDTNITRTPVIREWWSGNVCVRANAHKLCCILHGVTLSGRNSRRWSQRFLHFPVNARVLNCSRRGSTHFPGKRECRWERNRNAVRLLSRDKCDAMRCRTLCMRTSFRAMRSETWAVVKVERESFVTTEEWSLRRERHGDGRTPINGTSRDFHDFVVPADAERCSSSNTAMRRVRDV